MISDDQITGILRSSLLENQIALPADFEFATSEITLSDIDLDSISLIYVALALETALKIENIDFEFDERAKIKDLYAQIRKAANRNDP